MSDEIQEIRGTLPGDWWYLAPALYNLCVPLVGQFMKLPPLRPQGTLQHDGYHITVFGGPLGGILGIAVVQSAGDGRTQIAVTPATAASVTFWTEALGQLRLFAEDARDLRRETDPTADEVIERYYRSRAAGSRKTLRQIAMETTYSYDYLRKVKRQYDAAGKWGSKKEPNGS